MKIVNYLPFHFVSGLSVTDVTKRIGAMWRNLSEDEKEVIRRDKVVFSFGGSLGQMSLVIVIGSPSLK